MNQAFKMVAEFHRAFGHPAPEAPCIPPDERLLLRMEMMLEEIREYVEAVTSGDIEAASRELADIAYVVIGTAVECGMTRFGDIFAEVHRANMSKLGEDGRPIYRPDGKVLKGPNFRPPDIRHLLRVVE